MLPFHFYAPTYFAFGKGAAAQTGALAARFGAKKLLLHFGGGSVKKNGVLGAVTASLDAAGVGYVLLGGAQPNPRSGLVYEGIALCRKENIDFILAVGGGSVIDSAKAIALGVPYSGDFWDFFGTGKPVEKALPVATVLTIAAAGSEGSPHTVITHEETANKTGAAGDALRPVFSVLDPAYTQTLPAYQTACGITDIMVHVCERYFTNTREVGITDRLCEAVLKTMIDEAPKVMANPADYGARANIMWAGMIAHNDICGAGREQDWSSHAIEHELSALYDCAHGAGLAVITPAWMQYVLQHDVMRFAQFATRVWGCEMDFANPKRTALEGISRFKAFLAGIGMPVTFAQLGAKEEDIPALVKNLGITEEDTLGRFVKLGPKDAAEIYRLAL